MQRMLKGAAACSLAVAIAINALAACQPSIPRTTAAPSKEAPLAVADGITSILGRYAVNLLVLTLLDDADLPRFTMAAMPLMCGDDSGVSIDGHRVVDGVEAPLGSFVLQWRLRGYCPYGAAGPLLDGDIDVMVLRDDDLGLQAIVVPPRAAVVAQRID